ncbi:MAG: phosphate/phosphite/phosphonate ABC transporter substrate-binding protein [Oligoflexia bacterium]|nr:phosphate/phosphite/phosphonate ABC transporter substrate-binding protein [Oligoflexia bacterium]
MKFLWIACLLSLSAVAAPKKEVVIGFNPAENADVVDTNGKLFAEYYKKATGMDVKTFIATDYTALIEALRSGRVDFAFLPPFSYVKAEEIADAKVLMKSVRKGQSFFFSGIIVRADKGINKLEDLKGKNIAWVDPASSSGFIIPKAALMTKKKIDADKFFGKQVYAGSHDALVLSVLRGTVDAGATFVNDEKGTDGAWHQFLKSPEDRAKIKMVFVSDPIPGDTMATTGKFAKEHKTIVDQTTKLLAEMGNNEEGKKILTALYRIDSMIPATSKEYQPLRDAAKVINLEK